MQIVSVLYASKASARTSVKWRKMKFHSSRRKLHLHLQKILLQCVFPETILLQLLKIIHRSFHWGYFCSSIYCSSNKNYWQRGLFKNYLQLSVQTNSFLHYTRVKERILFHTGMRWGLSQAHSSRARPRWVEQKLGAAFARQIISR